MRLREILLFASLIFGSMAQYVPEPYGWSCYRMAAKRDWPECKFANAKKQKECLCGLPDFLQLTETCLQKAVVGAENPIEAASFARKVSLCVVAADVLNNTNSGSAAEYMIEYKDNVTASIPPGRVKKPLGRIDDIPEFVYIDPVSEGEIALALSTARWRMANDAKSERAGAALVGFWGLLLILKYIYPLMVAWLPRRFITKIVLWKPVKLLRSRLLNPALGRHQHREPGLQKLGVMLPIRGFAVTLLLFACLNYVLIFVDFPYTSQNFIYSTPRQQWCKSLAIRAAFMTMWKLPLVFCFASRNNVLLLIGHPWSLDTFNVFHKWLARMTVIDVIIHGVAISIVKVEQGLYPSVWKVEYWQWGICGVVVASIIAVQSIHWISRKSYETFKALHVVMVVVFVVATWYHVSVLPYGTKHCYAVFAIWGFDHVSRLARVILAGKIDARIKHVDATLSLITIENPPWGYNLSALRSPAFVFLHLPPYFLFWQSHPFSIVRSNKSFDHDFANGECIYPVVTGLSEQNSNTSGRGTTFGSASIDTNSVGLMTIDSNGAKSQVAVHTAQIARSSGTDKKKQEKTRRPQDRLLIAIKHRHGITERVAQLPEGPIRIALDGPYCNPMPLRQFNQVICIAGGIGITGHLSQLRELLENSTKSPSKIKIYWAVAILTSMEWVFSFFPSIDSRIEVNIYTTQQLSAAYRRRASQNPFVSIWEQRMNCSEIITNEVAQLNEPSEDMVSKSTAVFACGPDRLNDDARMMACWAIENANCYVDYFEEAFSW